METERQQRGKTAEDTVARALRMLGFRIEGRNVRSGRLEADILAADEEGLAVVEVRARQAGAAVDPFESVGGAKGRRLERLAAELAGGRPARIVLAGVSLRGRRPVAVRILDVT